MGERGPLPGHAYGAAAVASIFKNANFPMSKDDIMQKYGDREIEYTKGNPVKVKDVLSNIPSETFNSPADLEHAFHEKLS
ncbi:MAG: hypothetical protein A2255_01930 [Candidatus Melainabacteria bacterium RIFOXYA2_FULL_32_9]|nr:MAG: hypothetical protein A2255_01930 [Candidatus Melainabacteria bacterium RIFOXYA2_FULL_32_9]